MILLSAGNFILIRDDIDMRLFYVISFVYAVFQPFVTAEIIADNFLISAIKSIICHHISLRRIFVITDRIVCRIVLFLQMVLFDIVLIILVWFAAGHEPDGDNNIQSDYYEQIDRKHK